MLLSGAGAGQDWTGSTTLPGLYVQYIILCHYWPQSHSLAWLWCSVREPTARAVPAGRYAGRLPHWRRCRCRQGSNHCRSVYILIEAGTEPNPVKLNLFVRLNSISIVDKLFSLSTGWELVEFISVFRIRIHWTRFRIQIRPKISIRIRIQIQANFSHRLKNLLEIEERKNVVHKTIKKN